MNPMKWLKILFFLVFCTITSVSTAQRFAYVNTETILNALPEYVAARKQLNEVSAKWQKEIEAQLAEVDKMYRDYQVERILMSEEMRIKREEEIIAREREVKALQRKRFGQGGDLFKKQEEMLRPVQDKVYEAIAEIAETKGYAMVFDKAGSTTVIYSGVKFDLSDEVIKQLGGTPGTNLMKDGGGEDAEDEEEEEDGPASPEPVTPRKK
jgi:outer membrane protein